MPKVVRESSERTGLFCKCPHAVALHPQLLIAASVMRGPKAFWFECSTCGTREFVAPKLLKTRNKDGALTPAYGMTLDQVRAEGWIPSP